MIATQTTVTTQYIIIVIELFVSYHYAHVQYFGLPNDLMTEPTTKFKYSSELKDININKLLYFKALKKMSIHLYL